MNFRNAVMTQRQRLPERLSPEIGATLTVNEQTYLDDLLLSGSLPVLTFSTGLVDAARFLALGHVLLPI
jgi:hypothetical protein